MKDNIQDIEVRRESLGEVNRERVGEIELREEVPEVRVERVPAGSVTVRRELRSWTETVEVELREETLVLRAEPVEGEGSVLVDGEPLAPGEERRIVIYREEARVEAQPVLSERVEVAREVHAERQSIPVELRREELDVRSTGDAVVREDRGG